MTLDGVSRVRELGIFVALALTVLFFAVRATNFATVGNWQDIATDVAMVIVGRGRRDDGRADAEHRPQRRIDRRPDRVRLLGHARAPPRAPDRRHRSASPWPSASPAASATACSSPSGGSRRSSRRSRRSSIYRGILFEITNGQNVFASQLPQGFLDFAAKTPAGVPTLAWIAIAVALVGAALLRWAPWGRDFYAIGSNPDAARLAGIRVGGA